MHENDFKVGNVIKTGLCYGYSNGTPVELPLMVANITDTSNDQVELVGIISNPHTYVIKTDIHGIELNDYILGLLGFEEIDINDAQCSGNLKRKGGIKAFQAIISGKKILIIKDNDAYQLIKSASTPPASIEYVHEIQNHYMSTGVPLAISYIKFYSELNE